MNRSISDQTERRGRPRSEQATQAILKAAWALVRRQPVSRVSIEAIAREAGVGKATIYRWWPSRAAVVCDAFLQELEPTIPFPEADTAGEALTAQARSVARAMQGEFGRVVRELLAETASDDDALKLFAERFIRPRRAVAAKIIERGIESGEFRSDLDVERAMDMMYGPIYFRLLVQHQPIDDAFINAWPGDVLRALRALP